VIFYRCFPFDAGTAAHEAGGALFVPPSQGLWRIDNADLYDVLYLSERPEGAIAETFGRYSIWRAATFTNAAGQAYALARYALRGDASVVDLDDAGELVRLRLKPSDVVSRDRTKTQLWAREIYLENRGIGVGWWSYYEPDIHTFGLWDVSAIALDGKPVVLGIDHPDVRATAERISRPLISEK
jgi:hypothetical protein